MYTCTQYYTSTALTGGRPDHLRQSIVDVAPPGVHGGQQIPGAGPAAALAVATTGIGRHGRLEQILLTLPLLQRRHEQAGLIRLLSPVSQTAAAVRSAPVAGRWTPAVAAAGRRRSIAVPPVVGGVGLEVVRRPEPRRAGGVRSTTSTAKLLGGIDGCWRWPWRPPRRRWRAPSSCPGPPRPSSWWPPCRCPRWHLHHLHLHRRSPSPPHRCSSPGWSGPPAPRTAAPARSAQPGSAGSDRASAG